MLPCYLGSLHGDEVLPSRSALKFQKLLDVRAIPLTTKLRVVIIEDVIV